MKTRKQIEITIRTYRQLAIRGSVTTRGWCRECGYETDAVSLETAGVVAEAMKVGLGEPMVASELHMMSAGESETRVCLRSLLEIVRMEGERGRSVGTSSLVRKK